VHVPVPLFVHSRIVEPIIGTQVNNAASGIEQLGDCFHARRVRQCAENQFCPLSNFFMGQVLARQVNQTGQRRMNFSDIWIARLPCGQSDNICVWMSRQNLEEFQSRITSGSQYRDF
jgi:hypothetical protein